MLEEKFNCDTIKECLTILSFCENSLIDKIPKEVIKNLTDIAADSEQDFYVEESKSLLEQKISPECRDMLGLMYFMYVADDNEKDELLNTWAKNERDG